MERQYKLHYVFSIMFVLALIFNVSCNGVQKQTEINEDGFIDLFDGHSLEHWSGDETYWRVEDGMMVGEVTPATLLQQNTFIIWQSGEVEDFELKVEYRISEEGNSGINYRSEMLEGDPDEYIGGAPFALRGYQGDIDGKNLYTGMNYEERKRTTIARRGESVVLPNLGNPSLQAHVESNQWTARVIKKNLGNPDSLVATIVNPDWHEYHIIARGNHLQHFIDGILMSEVIDEDKENRKFKGLLGVQVHVGPPMKVEYRSIKLKNW